MSIPVSEELSEQLARDPAIRALNAQVLADQAWLHELLNETLTRTIALAFAMPANELPGTIGNARTALPPGARRFEPCVVVRPMEPRGEALISKAWKARWSYGLFQCSSI